MSRIDMLSPDDMTEHQRRVHDAIVAGPRGAAGGPFNALLRSPELADRAQSLGAFCRFGTTFEPKLSELAILVTARLWSAQLEWWAHVRLAQQAGLDAAIIAAIEARRPPTFADADQRAVYQFATMLSHEHRVSDAVYQDVRDRFGEQGVAELVGILGYYTLVSMALNTFEVPVPEGAPPPLTP